MKYPREFSLAARDAVDAEELKAEQDLRQYRDRSRTRPDRTHTLIPGGVRRWTDEEEDIIEYIVRVGLAFGLQACQLRSQGWSLHRIRQDINEFFRLLTIDAHRKYVIDRRRPGFIDAMGGIEPEVISELERSVQWHQLREALLATTEWPSAQPSQPTDPHPGETRRSADSEPGEKNPLVAEGKTGDFLAALFDQFDEEEQAEIRAAEESTQEIIAQGEADARTRQRAAGSHDVPEWVQQPRNDARTNEAGVVFVAYANALWRKTDAARGEAIGDFLANVDRLIAQVLATYGREGKGLIDVLRLACQSNASLIHSYLAKSTQRLASAVDSAADSPQNGSDNSNADVSHFDLAENGGGQSEDAGSSVFPFQPPTIVDLSDSGSNYIRSNADYFAMLRRQLGKNVPDERGEKLLQDARAWAAAELKMIAPEVEDLFELKERVVRQTYDRFVPNPANFPYREFASALWEEGSPSLEDRAIVTLGNHPGSRTILTEEHPSSDPGPEGNSQPHMPANGSMSGLPELPTKFQNAFESAKAKAELAYVNRALDFPHQPELAETGLQPLIRIEAVFFSYCDQAREACREGDWTAAQVSKSVDVAWPIICDYYSLRERGASSDEAKSVFRVVTWRTVQNEPRWKQHVSEIEALADTATKAASTARAAAAQPTEHPVATERLSRDEIEKFADDAFAIAAERIATDNGEKRRRALNQVARTRNTGGYLPALIKCAEERVRAMILARADAYVDAFTTFGVPSDARSEASLKIASKQIAGGAISAVRHQLELIAKRTGIPLREMGGSINRIIGAAKTSALNEGVLRLKRRRVVADRYKDSSQPAEGVSTRAVAESELSGGRLFTIGQLTDFLRQPLTPEYSAALAAAFSAYRELETHPDSQKLSKMMRIVGRMEASDEDGFRSLLPALLLELGLEIPDGVLHTPRGNSGTDDHRAGGDEVDLLLKIVNRKKISIETWAKDHRVGRTTLFDWKAARAAGKAPKGKVSEEKIAAIVKAIMDDAAALGLTTRTDSD